MKPPDLPSSIVDGGKAPAVAGPQLSAKESLWGTFAKAGATLVGLVAAELSLIGHITWTTWMEHWGFDAGQIPLDATSRVLQGYFALMDRAATLLSTWAGVFMTSVFIATGFYVSILLTARSAARRGGLKEIKVSAFFGRLPWWIKDILKAFGLSGFGVVVIYFLLVAAFLVLVTGPTMGIAAAQSWAARTELQIKNGCQREKSHGSCTSVVRDGKVLATGVILASSTMHVALYDMTTRRTRLLRLEDAELIGWVP